MLGYLNLTRVSFVPMDSGSGYPDKIGTNAFRPERGRGPEYPPAPAAIRSGS
jgi:hypothetical protein